ncbi:MAG: hypothetical protein PHH85_12615 [Candidatus Methanoperedens sp.]|nr:hypothetical protein [Candidatus Methanoperedens sp.]
MAKNTEVPPAASKNKQEGFVKTDPVLDIDGILTYVLGSDTPSKDGTKVYDGKVGIGLGTYKNKQWVHITYKQMSKLMAFIKKNADHFNLHLDKELERDTEIQRA